MPTRLRCLLALLCLTAFARAAESGADPRHVIVISVDQLRADYFERFGPHFGEGGFKRLLSGGMHFSQAYHRHAITHTAPGHASILTGVFANVHSVVSNDWIDPESWLQVNSVEDRESPLIGISPAEMGPAILANPAKAGRSPRPLAADTVGDVMKRRHGSAMKVFSAGNKDRSAILLGGKLADAAYWDENGKIVTSRYYRAELPAWVQAFNAEDRAGKAFGKTWERLLDPAIYERVQGPDDVPGESAEFGFTRTFPKKLDGGREKISPPYYTAFDNSPFATEMLGDFVMRAIKEEQLGRHAATDLLCIGFSQVDAIGHNYGPDSHEVMDSMLRLDRVLARLLDFVDAEIGLRNCLIVLASDHGVSATPERRRMAAPDVPAGRVKPAEMQAALKKALEAAFGPLPRRETWFVGDAASYHLRPAALQAKNISASAAAKVMKEALLTLPYIENAFTRDELLAGPAPRDDDSLLTLARRSYHAGRGRDVIYVFKPHFIARNPEGTTHGSAHAYDTHVPMLWYGRGIPAGVRSEKVGIDDLAPTLCGLLGMPAPAQAQGRRLFPERMAAKP